MICKTTSHINDLKSSCDIYTVVYLGSTSYKCFFIIKPAVLIQFNSSLCMQTHCFIISVIGEPHIHWLRPGAALHLF